MQAMFALTSSEARRLIAKAVAEMEVVKEAYKNGRLAITHGTTNAFVVEELTGASLSKGEFARGVVTDGRPCVSGAPPTQPYLLEEGKRVEESLEEFVKKFTARDVMIKGANAVDHQRKVGVLMGSPTGGTIGSTLPVLNALGANLVVPVGLEKLVPSVEDAARAAGIDRYELSLGMPVGCAPVGNAIVVTEIEALDILGGVKGVLLASGGFGGSEGSTILSVEGDKEGVEKMFQLVKKIKGEPPVEGPRRQCNECSTRCSYSRTGSLRGD